MSERSRWVLTNLGWGFISGLLMIGAILLISGCAALYKPAVDYALSQAEAAATERVEELIHEVATKPPPPLPPMGSSWTEYGVWGGSVALGSLAVLVDRRKFHKKQQRRLVNNIVPPIVSPPNNV